MNSKIDYRLTTLKSGIRLVIIPMPQARTVTAMVAVGTGSRNETKDLNGISHFLEHMIFKGTEKRPTSRDITRDLDGLGADYNAYTSKETTCFYAKTSADKIRVALDVISDIYQNSKLEEKELNIERGVILEEINMHLDQPQSLVGTLFEALMYGDQPAGWDILGTPETLKNITRPDFIKYFSTHYVAKNSVIAIAGNIEPDVAVAMVEELFSNPRSTEPEPKARTIEAQDKTEILLYNKKTDQTHLILGFRAFSTKDPRKYPLAILSSVLGGGLSSRLFEELRNKRGCAYYVYSSNTKYSDSGYFEVGAGVGNGKVFESIEAILNEIRKIKAGDITEDDVKRAIDQIVGRVEIGLEHSDALAESFANSVLTYGEVLTPDEELGKIKLVKPEDVIKVANEIFTPDKMNLAVVGPFEDKTEFDKILRI